MNKYYVELNNETCIISEIEDVVIHGEYGVRTERIRTVIESGGLNIMSDLGFYPVKAGISEKVEYNSGCMWAHEVKRVDFKFGVKYHEDGFWYEFDPALEIASDEDYGNIIGRRGETLDALQYLTRLFVNRASDDNKRVSLNVGDYRERRKETLKGLAARQAERALRIGRSCTLEPMNPYERRIIHTAIQGIDGVTSHSVGEGDNRRVVIIPENARDRRDRRNYGGRREKRAPYVPETPKEPREQKVDAVSSSRYGKIEPRKPAAPSSEEE